MYIKSIEIENTGPIEHVKLEFPINGDLPKPVILVGENGSGKSILISHIVNALISGKQTIFDDTDVDEGKVFKYRSPNYVKSGKHYLYSSLKFDNAIQIEEIQLLAKKEDFKGIFGHEPTLPIYAELPNNQSSTFKQNFQNNPIETENFYKKNCCLYFPVNRFEEPAWLNLDNLKYKPNYSQSIKIDRISNRNIINISPLRKNKDWILDVLFDRQAFEIKTALIPHYETPSSPKSEINAFYGFSGQSTAIYEAILKLLKIVLKTDGSVSLGAGKRKHRQIQVLKNLQAWIPNLFQLSTGEVELLNLFLSILRDYDLSDGNFNSLNDVKGIVIIDEIDSHLHTSHQKEVLPELIKSFPKVQFIITTHSPLFLLGMDEKFGSENFVIFNLPNGEQVLSSDFSEFNAAYDAFKETSRHRKEIKTELERSSKPLVYMEGEYDIRYLNKAAELLGREDILENIRLKDGDGFGNLDKIWRSYDNPMAEAVPSKIILLFDCDTSKTDSAKGNIFKRLIPQIPENPISKGIENLFSPETISKVEFAHPEFIDIKEASIQRIRSVVTTEPEVRYINKDEKGNMCNWLCENGTLEDFSSFSTVFDLIDSVINP